MPPTSELHTSAADAGWLPQFAPLSTGSFAQEEADNRTRPNGELHELT
jgi:hypothetical protein